MVKNCTYISSDESFVNENNKYIFIRAGFTDYNMSKTKIKDKDFEKNYKIAKDNSIPIGVYYESRATSLKEGKSEIDFYLSIIENKQFDYPISIIINDNHNTIIYYPKSHKTLKKEELKEIVLYMYKQLKDNNYNPLIVTIKDFNEALSDLNINLLIESNFNS